MCALLRDLQGSLCGLPCNLEEEEDLAYKQEEEEEERRERSRSTGGLHQSTYTVAKSVTLVTYLHV